MKIKFDKYTATLQTWPQINKLAKQLAGIGLLYRGNGLDENGLHSYAIFETMSRVYCVQLH